MDQMTDLLSAGTAGVYAAHGECEKGYSGDSMTADGEHDQPQTGTGADTAAAPDTMLREETESAIRISTRFGVMEFPKDQALTLPHGLLGFAGLTLYGLTNIPGTGDSQFKFLQSLEEPNLGFIVLPVKSGGGVIAEEHLQSAYQEHKVAEADSVVLLIVTIRPQVEGGVKLTANAQGPIIVDAVRRMAWQHVMHEGDYAVQHPL